MSLQFVPLPLPPREYNQQYFNELIRIFNTYFRAIQNPGDSVVNTLRILSLPTDPTNLPAGSVWYDEVNEVLRVSDANFVSIPLNGSTIATAAGTVTP